jgi:hypothetical protein
MSEMRASLPPEWEKALRQMFELPERCRADVARFVEQVTESAKAVAAWRDDIEKTIGPTLRRVAQDLREVPERNRKVTRTLARHGWYIDPSMLAFEPTRVAVLFEAGNEAEAHDQMCGHYDEAADALLESLSRQFPSRRRLLESAFAAHRRADYAASVPLFLAQADGICHELTGVQLYARQNGVPKLKATFSSMEEDFLLISVVTPLIETTPLSANEKERASMTADIMNRHAILHGEATDYDTHRNSCRAMSLIAYVAWAIDQRPHVAEQGGA